MIIGALGSASMGCVLPVFSNLTGNMIDAYGNADKMAEGKSVMLLFIYLAVAALVIGMIMSTSWNLSA